MFLILVDSNSKWLDVHIMSNISSIEKLRMIFATHGLPQKIVTDNGPSFTSDELQRFVEANGITHVTSSPYHPPQMARGQCRQLDFDVILNKKSYHNFYLQITLNVTTGIAPSELLMGCCLRTHLDALFPEISKKVVGRQAKQRKLTAQQNHCEQI